jgi:hypothetical protein
MSACGSCTACCRVFAVPQLDKPAGKWCQHCKVGVGCQTYHDRPQVCHDYECLWLQSQKRARPLPPELRPDRCKVVFTPTTNDSIMGAVTAPGYADAWRKGPVKDLIDQLLLAGVRTAVGPPAARYQTLVYRGGEHRVEMSPPDENGMQWRIDE